MEAADDTITTDNSALTPGGLSVDTHSTWRRPAEAEAGVRAAEGHACPRSQLEGEM